MIIQKSLKGKKVNSCPWCKRKNVQAICYIYEYPSETVEEYAIECQSCGAESNDGATLDEEV